MPPAAGGGLDLPSSCNAEYQDGLCRGDGSEHPQAVAQFGSAAFSDPTLETTEVDGAFHLDCSFRVLFHSESFQTDTLQTVVYDNGFEASRVDGLGDHTVQLRSLGPGFHELVRVVVNTSWISNSQDVWQCFLRIRGRDLEGPGFQPQSRADANDASAARLAHEMDCRGVLTAADEKINLFEYTLLAPALDPSLVTRSAGPWPCA